MQQTASWFLPAAKVPGLKNKLRWQRTVDKRRQLGLEQRLGYPVALVRLPNTPRIHNGRRANDHEKTAAGFEHVD